MKGGADLLRAEIKNCIICRNKVSFGQLQPLTRWFHVKAAVCLCFHSSNWSPAGTSRLITERFLTVYEKMKLANNSQQVDKRRQKNVSDV